MRSFINRHSDSRVYRFVCSAALVFAAGLKVREMVGFFAPPLDAIEELDNEVDVIRTSLLELRAELDHYRLEAIGRSVLESEREEL